MDLCVEILEKYILFFDPDYTGPTDPSTCVRPRPAWHQSGWCDQNCPWWPPGYSLVTAPVSPPGGVCHGDQTCSDERDRCWKNLVHFLLQPFWTVLYIYYVKILSCVATTLGPPKAVQLFYCAVILLSIWTICKLLPWPRDKTQLERATHLNTPPPTLPKVVFTINSLST